MSDGAAWQSLGLPFDAKLGRQRAVRSEFTGADAGLGQAFYAADVLQRINGLGPGRGKLPNSSSAQQSAAAQIG